MIFWGVQFKCSLFVTLGDKILVSKTSEVWTTLHLLLFFSLFFFK